MVRWLFGDEFRTEALLRTRRDWPPSRSRVSAPRRAGRLNYHPGRWTGSRREGDRPFRQEDGSLRRKNKTLPRGGEGLEWRSVETD